MLELEGEGRLEKDGFNITLLLMEHEVDVNKADHHHETPLHLALRLVFLKAAWLLLKHGANLDAENTQGKTPFQLVRESMRDKMKQLLSEYSVRRAQRTLGVVLMGLLYSY